MKRMTQKLTGESLNPSIENRLKLKKLFPEVFTETINDNGILQESIDFEKLKAVLGTFTDLFEGHREHYGMEWPGKKDALRLTQTPITATLKPSRDESINFDTTENLFIEGENLEVLKLLQKSYYGKVKMIYIDPPYNTGNNFIYPDNFTYSLKAYLEYAGLVDGNGKKLSGNTANEGRFHTKWLNMMYPRLYLARNLLRDDGVIFISIDDHEVSNLRKLCDEIFGEENFVSEFCWRKTDNQANIGNIARVKEYILVYTKNIEYLSFNKIELTDRAKKEYRYSDKNGKFRRQILLHKTRGRHHFKVKTPKGKILYGPWMIKHEQFLKLEEEDKIFWTPGGQEQPYGKLYLYESGGQIANDFLGIEYGTNQEASLEVESLFNHRYFDFPKPIALLKHFSTISTSNEDLIFDFFAGSATTAHAVLDLNKQDGGNRKFILVQLPEPCAPDSEAFKAGYKTIADIGKERIRRVIKKLNEEDGGNLDGKLSDRGFKVLKLNKSK